MFYLFYVPLYLIFGLLPSLIWLFFYLKKDAHPESNKTIIKIFFWGTIAAIIAAAVEIGIVLGIGALTTFSPIKIYFPFFISFLLYHFIVIALVEEVSKFLIVKETAVNKSAFDEPLDIMLYMVIAALGFAALENLLYLFSALFSSEGISFFGAILISGFRFVGATFLHALASGIIGFFLALSFFKPAKKVFYIATGIILATVLHGLFNISIIGIGEGIQNNNTSLTSISIISLIILLTSLGIFVGLAFKKLKKISSICKL